MTPPNAAFLPTLPLRPPRPNRTHVLRHPRHTPRPRHTTRPRARPARLTADTPTPPPPSPPSSLPVPTPHPLSPSPVLQSYPLLATLYSIFRSDVPPSEILTLSPSLTWHTPLFELANDEIPTTLTSFFSFAITPTLFITHINDKPESPTFSWQLSFTYPLPWRPRVSLAGSTVTDSLTSPTRITDTYFTSPFILVRQALPRLVDIIWLYPGPHAEVDTGCRKLLKKLGKYRVERFAGCAEVRVTGVVEKYEQELVFASPTLPAEAFEGGLRRRERYDAVAPVGVRLLQEGAEWCMKVPGGFVGSAKELLPVPGGEGVRLVNVDERVVVVDQFGGVALRGIVEERLGKLMKELAGEGIEVERERVWVRSYESKVGFNEKGMLAIAMYGSSQGVPRRNEIVVDVTGLVDEEFLNR